MTRRSFSPLDRGARRLVLSRLQGLRSARLILEDPLGLTTVGSGSEELHVQVRDPRFYREVLLGGHVGACESFTRGGWTTRDLVPLFQAFVADAATMDGLESGLTRWRKPLEALALFLRRNHRQGARRNIAAHYNLGNSFFAEWLDPTMTYSAGVFPHAGASLEAASIEKIDRLCQRLDLKPEHHLLEIGTGWGGFAMHAARHYGCRVTTTTISREQAALARMRFREAGLENRITLLEQDYRDLKGQYDRLVSVEMVEAVGHDHHETYFARCAELLTTDGLAAFQAITIRDQRYDLARRHEDFIKRHIFPGSCLLSNERILSVTRRATDLGLLGLEDITEDYARTLAHWGDRFRAAWDRLLADGGDEEFLRAWEIYLAYCEAGFRERHLGCVQFVMAKPGYRDQSYKASLRLRQADRA